MQRTEYIVQYNIPRVQVQLPGRQNRLMEGEFRVSPGLAEAVMFYFGNQDGVPMNLLPFTIKFVVWSPRILDHQTVAMGQSDIILAKEIPVIDPYSGYVEMLLEHEDTIKLGLHAGGNLRWSLFMINEERQVFPVQVSRSRGRFGTVIVDVESGMPQADLILSA